jgi:hypothetical protein
MRRSESSTTAADDAVHFLHLTVVLDEGGQGLEVTLSQRRTLVGSQSQLHP